MIFDISLSLPSKLLFDVLDPQNRDGDGKTPSANLVAACECYQRALDILQYCGSRVELFRSHLATGLCESTSSPPFGIMATCPDLLAGAIAPDPSCLHASLALGTWGLMGYQQALLDVLAGTPAIGIHEMSPGAYVGFAKALVALAGQRIASASCYQHHSRPQTWVQKMGAVGAATSRRGQQEHLESAARGLSKLASDSGPDGGSIFAIVLHELAGYGMHWITCETASLVRSSADWGYAPWRLQLLSRLLELSPGRVFRCLTAGEEPVLQGFTPITSRQALLTFR